MIESRDKNISAGIRGPDGVIVIGKTDGGNLDDIILIARCHRRIKSDDISSGCLVSNRKIAGTVPYRTVGFHITVCHKIEGIGADRLTACREKSRPSKLKKRMASFLIPVLLVFSKLINSNINTMISIEI